MNARVVLSLPDLSSETAREVETHIREHAPKEGYEIRTYPEEPRNVQEWSERLEGVDGIVLGWKIPDEALKQAESLRAISFLGTGIADNVSLPLCEEKGIETYTVSGYGDNAVAEHTIALMLAAWHDITELNRATHSGAWNEVSRRELRGSTLGIIGYGGIGQRVAEIAVSFGLNVLVWSRSLTPGDTLAVGQAVALEELLERSDIVSVHLALNPETRGFMSGERLARLKPGAVLVNTARADVVDTEALANALQTGAISRAGIDVFSREPVAIDNPLLGVREAILTPHIAYNTENAVKKLNELGTLNLVRHFWPEYSA